MTYRIDCGPSSDTGLVAVETLLSRVMLFPSADYTLVELRLMWHVSDEPPSNEKMCWLNGKAEIPNLGYIGNVRPQYLLKAIQQGVEPWPGMIVLVRKLEGVNRTLDYTIEFRMFGTTDNQEEIIGWAYRCYELCRCAIPDL